jgi:anaerobic selenocysteine-containing dehydrogenase
MNSSYSNVNKVRTQTGPADVGLSPFEAQARGLKAGDNVLLRNETGQLTLQVSLSDRIPPGVALVHKGRWPKLDPSGANVNVLNGGERADLGESSSVHSVEAELILISIGTIAAEVLPPALLQSRS